MIDVSWCTSRGACYLHSRLQELFPQPRTIREVLTLQERPWNLVPFLDRLWVAARYYGNSVLKRVVHNYLVYQFDKEGLDKKPLEPLEKMAAGVPISYLKEYHDALVLWTSTRNRVYLLLADALTFDTAVALNCVYRYESDKEWIIQELQDD